MDPITRLQRVLFEDVSGIPFEQRVKDVCDNGWAAGWVLAATISVPDGTILVFQPKNLEA